MGAYAFLNGRGSVTTSRRLRTDDGDPNFEHDCAFLVQQFPAGVRPRRPGQILQSDSGSSSESAPQLRTKAGRALSLRRNCVPKRISCRRLPRL